MPSKQSSTLLTTSRRVPGLFADIGVIAVLNPFQIGQITAGVSISRPIRYRVLHGLSAAKGLAAKSASVKAPLTNNIRREKGIMLAVRSSVLHVWLRVHDSPHNFQGRSNAT